TIDNISLFKKLYLYSDQFKFIWNQVQNAIKINGITNQAQMDANLNNIKSTVFDNINVKDNNGIRITANMINSMFFSNGTMTINLFANNYYIFYSNSWTSNTSPVVTANVSGLTLTLNNLAFKSTSLEPSPENWFIWNGNKIMGLSGLGQEQSYFVLPSRTNSISSGTFYNNKNVRYVDMSLTSITSIDNGESYPNDSYWTGLFARSSIETVIFPRNATSLGSLTFAWCTSIKSITWPTNSNWTIPNNFFFSASIYTTINIPSNQTYIEMGSFEYSRFYSQTVLTIPTNIIQIVSRTFRGISINTISILGTNVSISSDAFDTTSSLKKIIVKNSTMRQRVIDAGANASIVEIQ
ncbi:MAG: leucine-rich repeat domain-containing protein, partial [Ureaplasma sp.]|nr:leucine-rich repeat domain-containing protein [Ureaplasma sp.]